MTRVLLRLFLRSRAVYLVALTLGLEIPTYLESRNALGHNWASTLEVANGSAVILVILGAVGACALTISWRRHSLATAGLPRRAMLYPLLPGLLVAGAVLGAHLVWVAFVMLAQAASTTGPFEWLPLAPPAAAIVAGSLIGNATGQYVRSWIAPPLLGLALYIALINLSGGTYGNLITVGGIDAALDGIHLDPQVALAQTMWFATVAATATLLTVLRPLVDTARLLFVMAVPALALLTAASALAVVDAGVGRFVLTDVNWTCLGDQPTFCVPAHETATLQGELPRLVEAHNRWDAIPAAQAPDTYWGRLDLPVPGHQAEFTFNPSMTDHELVRALIEATYPCSMEWTYEQYMTSDALAEALTTQPLADTAATGATTERADVGSLRC